MFNWLFNLFRKKKTIPLKTVQKESFPGDYLEYRERRNQTPKQVPALLKRPARRSSGSNTSLNNKISPPVVRVDRTVTHVVDNTRNDSGDLLTGLAIGYMLGNHGSHQDVGSCKAPDDFKSGGGGDFGGGGASGSWDTDSSNDSSSSDSSSDSGSSDSYSSSSDSFSSSDD